MDKTTPPYLDRTSIIKEALDGVVRELQAASFSSGLQFIFEHMDLAKRNAETALEALSSLQEGQQLSEEVVAWMSENGKEFVESWAHDQWVKDAGPSAEFFLPRFPIPLYRRLSPVGVGRSGEAPSRAPGVPSGQEAGTGFAAPLPGNATLTRLRENVKYMWHTGYCKGCGPDMCFNGPECTCGLNEAMQSTQTILGNE